MIEQEDWLFRPIMRGMLQADRLIDGSVDLEFISLLNEAISVEQENNRRVERAAQRKRTGK